MERNRSIPVNFISYCVQNTNNCEDKCSGKMLMKVETDGEIVLTDLENGAIKKCPIFHNLPAK